jgi:hypothetical protein
MAAVGAELDGVELAGGLAFVPALAFFLLEPQAAIAPAHTSAAGTAIQRLAVMQILLLQGRARA